MATMKEIAGAVINNVTPNDTVDTMLVQNSDETLIDNQTSFLENEIEAVTITQEAFEDIPAHSNTEKVVFIPFRRVKDSNMRMNKTIEGNLKTE